MVDLGFHLSEGCVSLEHCLAMNLEYRLPAPQSHLLERGEWSEIMEAMTAAARVTNYIVRYHPRMIPRIVLNTLEARIYLSIVREATALREGRINLAQAVYNLGQI